MQAWAPTAHTNLCHPPSLSKMTTFLHVTNSNPFPPLGRQHWKKPFFPAEIKVNHPIGLRHKVSDDRLALNENKESNPALWHIEREENMLKSSSPQSLDPQAYLPFISANESLLLSQKSQGSQLFLVFLLETKTHVPQAVFKLNG